MGSKLRRLLAERWYYVAFLLSAIVLVRGALYLRNEMHEETRKVAKSISAGNAEGYIQFLKGKLSGYEKIVRIAGRYACKSEQNPEELSFFLKHLMEVDTSVVSLWAVNRSSGIKVYGGGLPDEFIGKPFSYKKVGGELWHDTISDGRFVVVRYSTEEKKEVSVGIKIDLLAIHNQFIKANVYRKIYQFVLNSRLECVYHPNEKKIGKQLVDLNLFDESGNVKDKKYNWVEYSYSDLLNMPVLKAYNKIPFAGTNWIVASVSPTFDIEEILMKSEWDLMILLAFSFLVLSVSLWYGARSWKKEYTKAADYEVENLNLMLKSAKQEREAIARRIELLRTGLNTHFLFNSLGTLKALISDQNTVARKIVDDLARLYRYHLVIEGQTAVTVQEEYDFAETYIEIFNQRFRNAVELVIHDFEKYKTYFVVPVSIQMLVENCIKHNIASTTDPLRIEISFSETQLTVKNKLAPKNASKASNKKGLENLRARYAAFTGQECVFEVVDGFYLASIPVFSSRPQVFSGGTGVV